MMNGKIKEETVISLTHFIREINYESKLGALIVVEGQNDAEALHSIGFIGNIFLLCHNKNVIELDKVSDKYTKIILLLDLDRKGRSLTKKLIHLLQGRNKIDLTFRRKLVKATKGKIKEIEELNHFKESVKNLDHFNV